MQHTLIFVRARSRKPFLVPSLSLPLSPLFFFSPSPSGYAAAGNAQPPFSWSASERQPLFLYFYLYDPFSSLLLKFLSFMYGRVVALAKLTTNKRTNFMERVGWCWLLVLVVCVCCLCRLLVVGVGCWCWLLVVGVGCWCWCRLLVVGVGCWCRLLVCRLLVFLPLK